LKPGALAAILLIVGLAIGFGIGYATSPGKVHTVTSVETLVSTSTTTTTILSTVTKTAVTTFTPSIEYRFLDKYGRVQLAIAVRGYRASFIMSSANLSVELCPKALMLWFKPAVTQGASLIEVKIYDARGNLLAVGSETVSFTNTTQVVIPIKWLSSPSLSKVARVDIKATPLTTSSTPAATSQTTTVTVTKTAATITITNATTITVTVGG